MPNSCNPCVRTRARRARAGGRAGGGEPGAAPALGPALAELHDGIAAVRQRVVSLARHCRQQQHAGIA